ncbi:MAG: radical SAM protein [Candidatus Omnitrophica bacterium]|nr:radical SAM protein [Candidatus Omnitrophota bacterium]
MNIQKIIWQSYKNRILRDKQDFLPNISNFIPGNLVFVITSRCNFACKHCLRNFDSAQDLPFEILEKVVLSAKKYNFKYACLTGGEPLLYPQFNEAIELFVKNNYAFSIVTNGYDFEKAVPILSKYKNRIAFVAFSLESTDRKKHDAIRKAGSFDKLLEDFDICRAAGIPFRVITAASCANYDEMFDIAVFVKKKGAKAFAVTTVLPCPRSEDNNMVLTAQKRQELFVLLRQLTKTIKFPIMLGSDIRANNNIQLCNSFYLKDFTVDMNANLLQCCELSNFDDENIRKNAVIADLKTCSFDDALKMLSGHIHNFNCARIEDYKKELGTEGIDFNSCFYCVRKLSQSS